jgi:predicted O-linked N-acetylglucosamine transferase (SPINDLY family)
MEGVLKAHDRERFEIFAYYAHPFEDLVSLRLKGYVDHWVPCAAMEDEGLAQRIKQDGIDILVDLAGHSQGNRLLAFARRAAPVQVSWIGYQNTTGLSTMDYRLTDRFADPEGETEQLYTEHLVRLPIRQCFEPPLDAPDVSPLPALGSGRITFGALNAFRKTTPACLDLWAQVLRTLPEARLLMLEAGSPKVQEFLNTAFSDRGVAPERLELRGKVSFQDFLSLHAEVDIALDPYPYGGGTTTCLGLWMGVPVVTLQGPSIASRSGARLLAPMSMEDWIAQDAEAYVRVAVCKARDLEALARLREGLRDRMRNSALGDPQTLTRALEAAYRNMMETWHRTHAAHVGDSHAGS